MKQQQKKSEEQPGIFKDENKVTPEQRTGVYSPDSDDAAANNVQESEFGSRSYASPDFFKKKPRF